MHFFTEHLLINHEILSFGPDAADRETVYNLTASFSFSGQPKAFACQTSKIVVIPSANSNLVNVILQPIESPGIPFSKIEYFIYKGILKSSFFSGASINSRTNASNSDFIKRLWRDFDKWKAIDPAAAEPTPANLGFTSGTENPSINEIFSGDNSAYSYKVVRAGEWIGSFDSEGGFEIVSESDNLDLKVNDLKSARRNIDIRTLPSASPADQFKIRIEKEKILNHIDPAAFWGMHYETGIDIYDANAANKKRGIKSVELYATIISKYSNKNKVYLDIRSEHGYSYNFYQNYGDTNSPTKVNIKFKTSDVSEINHRYDRDWPIYSSDGEGIERGEFSSFVFQLRIDDNTEPLLFSENKKIIPNLKNSHFLATKDLKSTPTAQWTKDIEVIFPNLNNSGQKIFVANYLKIQYFRQTDSPASPPTVLKTAGYIDNGVALPQTTISPGSKQVQLIRKGFRKGDAFSQVCENGLYSESDEVLLYTKSIVPIIKSNSFYPKISFSNDTPRMLLKNNSLFPKEILLNKWQVDESETTKTDILEVVGFNKQSQVTNVEDLFLLGITKTEYDSLRNLPGLENFHSKTILFKEIFNSTDSSTLTDFYNHLPYKKFRLEIQGLDEQGLAKTIGPAPDINVYGSNLNFLSSRNFAAASDLPNLLPDPGLMAEFISSSKMTYDPSNPIVTGIFPMGTVKVADKNEMGFPNPISAVAGEIYFPVDNKTSTTLSTRKQSYPLLVIIHGNGHNYQDYEEVCRHLAQNGFIAVTFSCKFQESLAMGGAGHGMGALGRANLLYEHLKIIWAIFGNKVQNKVGLIGHSRGGEAVVRAAKDIGNSSAPEFLRNISAIISLAPTDQYDIEHLTQDIPYFVLYGSKDGDVDGRHYPLTNPRTGGFSLWDRANNNAKKSMAFVYGATHNGFITDNHDFTNEIKWKSWFKKLLPEILQKNIAKSYFNAFFRVTLNDEFIWKKLFTGELRTKLVSSAEDRGIYFQYRDEKASILNIDDFQDSTRDWVFTSALSPEGELIKKDPFSPHDTRGLKVSWKANDKLTFKIPAAKKNVSSFGYVSFRISKVAPNMSNLINLGVRVTSRSNGNTNSFVLLINKFYSIPDPDPRPDPYVKSALMTIRLPLSEYSNHGVDLSNVMELVFLFPNSASGEADLDSIEFTN